MFTIFTKKTNSSKYGKHTFDRYYKSWKNAKDEMDNEVNQWLGMGATIVWEIDRMNAEKGFYEYQTDLRLEKDGEVYECSFALVDGYFQDNND